MQQISLKHLFYWLRECCVSLHNDVTLRSDTNAKLSNGYAKNFYRHTSTQYTRLELLNSLTHRPKQNILCSSLNHNTVTTTTTTTKTTKTTRTRITTITTTTTAINKILVSAIIKAARIIADLKFYGNKDI
uniref:Uncharacterized protein n=1 Tax=Glossina palpalis gambiensis TaxID=67801 RepID=A0A1B0C1L5_9MUSC